MISSDRKWVSKGGSIGRIPVVDTEVCLEARTRCEDDRNVAFFHFEEVFSKKSVSSLTHQCQNCINAPRLCQLH